MLRPSVLCLSLILVMAARPLHAQVEIITIEAGSPEDKAIQAISDEKDTPQKIVMLKDFVRTYAGNKFAVAYGYSQLSNLAQTAGEPVQALAFGDQSLQAVPNNLEALVSQANIAQQLKDSSKVVAYAARGGEAVNGIAKQPKPATMSDSEFENLVARERESSQQGYEYLEASAISAISSETDAKQMLADLEKFDAAFPKSRFQEQAAQFAMMALQQVNDTPRLLAFGEKALAADPDNLPMMTMLANALAEDPKGAYLGRAIDYARKAIAVAKADEPGADRKRKLSAGLAHSAIGYALMKQDKTVPAIAELKAGSGLLQDDPAAYSTVLYRLGFAYAKLKRYPEAREVLSKAVTIQGPFREPSRELLGKVNAAGTKKP